MDSSWVFSFLSYVCILWCLAKGKQKNWNKSFTSFHFFSNQKNLQSLSFSQPCVYQLEKLTMTMRWKPNRFFPCGRYVMARTTCVLAMLAACLRDNYHALLLVALAERKSWIFEEPRWCNPPKIFYLDPQIDRFMLEDIYRYECASKLLLVREESPC